MSWATERLDELQSGRAEPPPVVRTLQVGTLDVWSEGRVSKRWVPTDDVLNGDGSMFGVYIAALADQMLGFAAMTVVPEGSAFRTINLNVQFIRIGRAHPLLIEAMVVSATKSLIVAEVVFLREDGELIARASAQQLVVPFTGSS
jgi:uncharacterized protein (TIGR00369 family)